MVEGHGVDVITMIVVYVIHMGRLYYSDGLRLLDRLLLHSKDRAIHEGVLLLVVNRLALIACIHHSTLLNSGLV